MVQRGYCTVRQLVTVHRGTVISDILVALCRFDEFILLRSYLGPFIPCERRLADMGILRNQGRDI